MAKPCPAHTRAATGSALACLPRVACTPRNDRLAVDFAQHLFHHGAALVDLGHHAAACRA